MVTLTAASVAVAASPEERAAARQHSNQAEKLKKRGQLAEACRELEQVERLDPKLPSLIELAECTEQLGKVVEAHALWAAARDRAKRDEKPQSKAKAEARLAATQKRMAHLTLQLAPNAPAGAQVLSDEATLDAASLASPLPMNPGEHVIVVKAAGHDDAKYAVKLNEGDKQTLAIAVGPATDRTPAGAAPAAAIVPAAPPVPTVTTTAVSATPAAPQDAPPSTGWWSEQRTAGVIFGSAGVVALGAGSALLITAKGDVSDRRLTGGAISLAAGGVLFISGVVLLISAPSHDAAQQARPSVLPTFQLARDAAVLGAVGEF
jgi:hypothetical protein